MPNHACGGAAGVAALLDAGVPFTGVFAANDLSAIGALRTLHARGIGVPEDVSVVGFDDLRLSRFTIPALTTVHQPAVEIARRATQLLLDLAAGREVRRMRHLLEPTFVVRGSTAPPRGGA